MLINGCENKQDTAFSACLYSQKEKVKTRINEITAKKKKSYCKRSIAADKNMQALQAWQN